MVELYGYESDDGMLTGSDYDAGDLLGSWYMPYWPGFGADLYFNVTTFLQSVNSSHVGFNLRSNSGGALYSSLEFNYGHPAQLIVTPVPVPGSGWLLMLAFALLGMQCVNRARRRSAMRRATVIPAPA